MKNIVKRLLLLITVLTMILSFASCDLVALPGGKPDQPDQPPVKDELELLCEHLNELAGKDHADVTLTTTTVVGSVTLESVYDIKQTSVEYRIEKIGKFVIEDGVITAPESYKTVYTGTAITEGDKVISFEGDIVELPDCDVLVGCFIFSKDNFDNCKINNGTFTCDVKNATKFWGGAIDAANMKISVTYNDDAITSLTATYDATGSSVTANYVFN